jgi:uncharacterized membrane protein YdfJ with MMPL/SSD domain
MVLFDFSRRRGAGREPGGVAARSSSSPLERWTVFVLRFRFLILAGWLAVLATGISLSFLLPAHLANSFAVPGTDSERADSVLAHDFGDRPEGTFTVVFRVRHSSDNHVQDRLRGRLERAARVLPGGQLGTFRGGGGVIYGELETSLGLQRAKAYTSALRTALRSGDGPTALITGEPAIQHDLDPRLASDLRRGEALALPLALLVLALVLGLSIGLALPFVFAACTIAGTLAVLYPIARLLPVSSYATNIVQLIGLGLAVDYSLLIVSRYREEIAADGTREQAIVRTMASAGRAVVFSGFAVTIGLALLLFVPVPFVRTLGLAGVLIPLVSIAAALTLQPALLSFCGRRAVTGLRLRRRKRTPREPWAALTRTIMRRPIAVLLPTTALLLAAAAPTLFLHLGPGLLASLPRSTEATRGLATLSDAFGPGALAPTQVVVDAGAAGGALRPDVHAAVERLTDALFQDPEVYVVATGPDRPYVSRSGRYARIVVIGRHEYGAAASQRLVTRLRERLVPTARFPAGTEVLAGGAAPKGVDFLARTYGFFPWLVLAALVMTYFVLVRSFRSALLPLKAVFLNLLTVGATYGLLVLVFHFGVGADLLGVQSSAQIEGWIPVFLFAALFGLSMDYEVFMLSRMREAYDETGSTDRAIELGLSRTGKLVTSAALILMFAFLVLSVSPGYEVKLFAIGLAAGIIFDATVIRALLVPSLMKLLGSWNWWMPAWTRSALFLPKREPVPEVSADTSGA